MSQANSVEVMTAAETARCLKAKEMSPAVVIDFALERIVRRNPSLNAFVDLDPDTARSEAQNLEKRVSAGDDVGGLAGVPTAVTGLFNNYPGWPSSLGGVPALKGVKGASRSLYPRRMEASGAIILGYTNSSPLGFTSTCDNRLFRPTLNPFDMARNCGGAASGSAAAVADGLIPIAGAIDGGGWIRTAAAWCGVFGFQSSHGRVARLTRPSAFEVSPFAFDGAITRTVEDSALALNALTGYERDDPFSTASHVDWTEALSRSIHGRKIGFCPNLGGFPIAPEIAKAPGEAIGAFEAQGAKVVPLGITFSQSPEELAETWRRMIAMRMAGALNGLKHLGLDLQKDFRDDIPAEVWISGDKARAIGLADIRRDQQMRMDVYDALQRALSEVDVIACASVGALPVENGPDRSTTGPGFINGEVVDPVAGWCLGFLTNFSGHPSASIPAGFANGLPVGLQLIGQRHGDVELLSVCAAFEAARPWAASYNRDEARALNPK
jgi:amidase/aspartyl-tRNA(Asn)/glutamyl-tRNA(Gln) amidotransferase subunit A